MANYAVTDYVITNKSPTEIAAAFETYLETIDTAKTIRYIGIVEKGSACTGIIIHDA